MCVCWYANSFTFQNLVVSVGIPNGICDLLKFYCLSFAVLFTLPPVPLLNRAEISDNSWIYFCRYFFIHLKLSPSCNIEIIKNIKSRHMQVIIAVITLSTIIFIILFIFFYWHKTFFNIVSVFHFHAVNIFRTKKTTIFRSWHLLPRNKNLHMLLLSALCKL